MLLLDTLDVGRLGGFVGFVTSDKVVSSPQQPLERGGHAGGPGDETHSTKWMLTEFVPKDMPYLH